MIAFQQTFSRLLCSSASRATKFAMVFDIDGVIMQGHKVIPQAVEAFGLLRSRLVPYLFLTNSDANTNHKAAELSNALSIPVNQHQIVSAYSPLKLFVDLHAKRTFVCGQGSYLENAKSIGFTNIVTLDDIRMNFPELDYMNQQHEFNKENVDYDVRSNFKPIEGVLLIGCPKQWESYCQVIVDLVATGGDLFSPKDANLPFYICNRDLTWQAAASQPRIGHGSFISCIEHLVERTLGKTIQASVVTGKPELISYRYLEHVIRTQDLGVTSDQAMTSLYFVGDNPCADIRGANRYKLHLQSRANKCSEKDALPNEFRQSKATIQTAHSVLVRSGVFKDHQFDKLPSTDKPDYVCDNVLGAVKFALSS